MTNDTAASIVAEINENGSVRKLTCGAITINLFIGNEIEGGPTNVYLRRHVRNGVESILLLGPGSPTLFSAAGDRLVGAGSWEGIEYTIALVAARSVPAWFWHVELVNTANTAQEVDLTYAQDLALAHYGAVRMNEFYVSQYIDHTPLTHADRGAVVASRQNQAVDGRNPWCVIGSLRRAESFATDALQFHGLTTRAGSAPATLLSDLPKSRLQHEHSMVVIRDERILLEPQARIEAGFFGAFRAHHPEATSEADLVVVDQTLYLAEARFTGAFAPGKPPRPNSATLFSAAPPLRSHDLDSTALNRLFGDTRRHEELDGDGNLLSFFREATTHVVLRAKELSVLRPHGHLLRTGLHVTPDETALTSTAWMSGVFHSMLTQGHVSINRFLSTTHSYLSLFRSHGQRVFVKLNGEWRLLDVPSAFEISPDACRWIYRHRGGEIHVRAEAKHEPQELVLTIEFVEGDPLPCLISHHVALNGDDGSTPGRARWQREQNDIVLIAAPDSDVGRRFPTGTFRIAPIQGTQFDDVAGDELLFMDGHSREQPFLCIVTAPTHTVGLSIRGELLSDSEPKPLQVAPGSLYPQLSITVPESSSSRDQLSRLADIVPWFTHNALVHYLSPRGLEQYSGGGWGTRDVCQGPVEMLLPLDRVQPIRDVLLRVMSQQNADGDWPQWFMFFERERGIRPGDSHGDIVFWPLVVLAQYLIASGEASVLDENVRFFDHKGPGAGENASVWQHAQRALDVIRKRVIPGTSLAAYGHGDWNDSLQPANPMMRDHLCSAWTVTLHVQTLTLLARALRSVGRSQDAEPLETDAEAIRQDFQTLLVADGVLTGYALFKEGTRAEYLLHPSDETTGVHYSALAMIHAILEDLFTPEQTQEHLKLLSTILSGPDGVRLFDRPMIYHGGIQRLFQRAETATYFGREIGLMYMHAHLRYAQALARVGDAEGFFKALCQANPIGIRAIVPTAPPRQANCYYSSSDATFKDRYQASAEYDRVASGTIALEGGWRVYSSGAGIALGLIMRHFLGLSPEHEVLSVDPVIPLALDGLKVSTTLFDRPVEVSYKIRASGAGVSALYMNDAPLGFTQRPNPYRKGAAAVARAEVVGRLDPQRNQLRIEID